VSTVMALVDWLRDQIAEDERVALAATTAVPQSEWTGPTDRVGEWQTNAYEGEEIEGRNFHIYNEGGHSAEHARHIAAWDPSRVLAEVAAKRAVLARIAVIQAACGWEFTDAPDLADGVLYDLAQPYADRPGFRPEWTVVPPA
jgi:hypothetical protein